MTDNQLKFLAYEETMRANKARESETERANRVGELHERAKIDESIRHNTASEGIDRTNAVTRQNELEEKIRHNKKDEAFNTSREAREWIFGSQKLTNDRARLVLDGGKALLGAAAAL